MSRRTARVAERIRQELSTAIPTLKNPDIGFVTVTGVEVSADLRYATVYVTALPTREQSDPEKSIEALRHSRGFLQHAVAPSLKLRVTPELRFVRDDSVERAAEVSDLIRHARATDRDAGADTPPDAGDVLPDASPDAPDDADRGEDRGA